MAPEDTLGNEVVTLYFDTSKLRELGLKGSFLNDALYFALSAPRTFPASRRRPSMAAPSPAPRYYQARMQYRW